jgi:RNA polymerase sigma-70 factor (ECF subfamily)
VMVFRLPDEELARRAAGGRLDCFEELLARYQDRVHRICHRGAGNAEDAEDWTQECFLRVYRQLDRYDPALPFAPWLLRVVANSCIDLARTRSRRQDRIGLGLTEETGGVETAPDPLDAVLSAEEARVVFAAVGALSPPLRQALVLRFVEGLSFRELAEVLGVPLQTAATRVRRALALVRERLDASGIEVDP